MKKRNNKSVKSATHHYHHYVWIAIGAFLAAFSIEIFLLPNRLIDGGIIGIAMICSHIFGKNLLALFIALFTIPFLFLAYRHMGKMFLYHMLVATIFFIIAIFLLYPFSLHWNFKGDPLEVVVIGGSILGIGIGLIIRYGGCLDGSEIIGLIINNKLGISVGQVVLVFNIFIFCLAGLVFRDWHPPILSLITFMIATRVMDAVIIGLDETKSVLIVSPKSQSIAKRIIKELGLGLTIMYGRGGFSGDEREIIYVISERLQLAELKELIYSEDPTAFIAVENLYEVSFGLNQSFSKKRKKSSFLTRLFSKT